jgi:hypothetical protein
VRALPITVLATLLLAWPAAGDEPVEAPPSALPADNILSASGGDALGAATPLRLWVGADYVLWWLREGRLAPTLTTSPQASRGLLGQPDTEILYGGDGLPTRHGNRFNGVRATLGYWFDEGQACGVEGNGFFLERDSTYFKATSDGGTLLARVYENPDGSPASEIIAGQSPTGPRVGGFVGYSRVELFGEEANFVALLAAGDGFRLEALAGARFLQMRDRTDLTASGRTLPDQTTLFGLEDHFRAGNAYYGGQVGVRGELSRGPWFVNLRGEVGLGADVEQVRAFGSSVFQTPTQRVQTPVGLSVQASNAGTFRQTALNMVSEVDLNVGYRVTDHVRVYAGYTFLLWDSPVRSGDQIDPVVNKSAGTPPARPAIPFKEDLFWAQGINGGVELSW